MRKAAISDVRSVILILQDEIRRSYEARYDHRLDAILLVAKADPEEQRRFKKNSKVFQK